MIIKYSLIEDYYDLTAGTIVHWNQAVYDFGLAEDDTEDTDEHHISVSLKPDGSYPLFTIPFDHLERLF